MQVEKQVNLDSEECLHSQKFLLKDRDHDVATTSLDPVIAQQPVKKQTRQWAAWTRQEEESFFTALRQVGKNFEKITCRVQSKNKDQVRHYYYRLVRRMNKLLGPDLYLDAKNSKDTNAAMLRWWSLLEKYSCKASKLHLKPRRFKIFIENLEQQLLKDRKKNVRKQPSQGENSSITDHGRVAGHDTRSVKMVLVDSQNIPKLGCGKGSSLKRNANLGINRTSGKGDSSPVKAARHRRKQGAVASTAAYKRWEKAAIAGVSLVADAAEHLERTASGVVEMVQECTQGKTSFDLVEKDAPISQTSPQKLFLDNTQQNFMKLKLQLFPIDEFTRRVLEMDNHNPHLELTLSTRKKISSIVEHLNRKWGTSSIASGELTLLPYCVQRENVMGNQQWTNNSVLNAADVYALIGSPPVFRLRYGWFSNTELGSATCQAPLVLSTNFDGHDMNMNTIGELNLDRMPVSMPSTNHETLNSSHKDQVAPWTRIDRPIPSSTDNPSEVIGCASTDPNNNVPKSSDNTPTTTAWQRKDTGHEAAIRQVGNTNDLRTSNYMASSVGEWADSLTNISVGDLLSDTSHNVVTICAQQSLPGGPQCLQQVPFSCDSFDAAIAAHIYKHQVKTGSQAAVVSHASSIWDAEETCDAFTFQENSVFSEKVQGVSNDISPYDCNQTARTNSGATDAEELSEAMEPMDGDHGNGEAMNEFQSDSRMLENSAKDLSALTDIYWPESLGPLDLDIHSCRYHSDDLILSDSLSGLNRLIASSLDAFQNCSFFGFDKKEPASTVEAQENNSFSEFKIHSEV